MSFRSNRNFRDKNLGICFGDLSRKTRKERPISRVVLGTTLLAKQKTLLEMAANPETTNEEEAVAVT